jgi:DNA-binding NarL/FixJ family response regulator
MSNHPISVLIVEDYAIVRAAMRAVLQMDKGIWVIGEAADGHEALDQAALLKPEVIILDLMMPRLSGFDVIKKLKQTQPAIHLLVFTELTSDEAALAALTAGAAGYLSKRVSVEELVQAIYQVHRGGLVLESHRAARLRRKLALPANALSPIYPENFAPAC